MILLPLWYFVASGAEVGPVTFQTLKVLAGRGLVLPQTPVKCKPADHWEPADGVDGLFGDATTTHSATTTHREGQKYCPSPK